MFTALYHFNRWRLQSNKIIFSFLLCQHRWYTGINHLKALADNADSHTADVGPILQVNSASYPSRDGKWVVAYELRGEGLVWLIGAVVCLCAALRVHSICSLSRAMDGRIMRRGIISSCQSAATSEIVKRFWSRAHV